jgi:hypothetical protein
MLKNSRQQVMATLREHVRRLERGSGRSPGGTGLDSVGLDGLLPERGFPRGTLVEWLAEGEGSGAGVLAWLAVRKAAAEGGAMVVLDRRRSFYPPAAAALGVELQRVMVVRAGSSDDELWALDQALRCPGVAAVWGVIDQLPPRWFRRLQLAAETGGGIGHLLRPARVRGWPSWSYAQLLVQPLPTPAEATPPEVTLRCGRRWRVELTRCHGLARGRAMEVELDELTGAIREAVHETRPMHLASQLACPAPPRRSARA